MQVSVRFSLLDIISKLTVAILLVDILHVVLANARPTRCYKALFRNFKIECTLLCTSRGVAMWQYSLVVLVWSAKFRR